MRVIRRQVVLTVSKCFEPNRYRLELGCGHTIWLIRKRKPTAGGEQACGMCSYYTQNFPPIKLRMK